MRKNEISRYATLPTLGICTYLIYPGHPHLVMSHGCPVHRGSTVDILYKYSTHAGLSVVHLETVLSVHLQGEQPTLMGVDLPEEPEPE